MKFITAVTYIGLFLRQFAGETPENPVSPTDHFSQSPDIIFAGTQPLSVQEQKQYASDYSLQNDNSIYTNQNNYIYLRVLNSDSSPRNARVWLYYVSEDLVLFPYAWNAENILSAQSQANYVDLVNIPLGGPIIINPPFQLIPQNLNSGQNYFVIGYVDNDPDFTDPSPQQPSELIGSFNSVNDLYTFLSAHPEIMLLSTSAINNFDGQWQTTQIIKGPNLAGEMLLGVQVSNIPMGVNASIAYEIVDIDPSLSLSCPKTIITTPNCTINSAPTNWPANYQATITITYWQDGTLPSNATIIPYVGLITENTN